MAVGTTRGKRRLGRFVKPIRERSGLTVQQVADRATCSPHTVYRLEAGEALPSRVRVAAILAVIGATDDERERALQLHAVADLGSAPIQHYEDLPTKYRRFRMDESEAVSERTLDMVFIPGPLQTEAYAESMSTAAKRLIRSDDWPAAAGSERRERHSLLTRERAPLAFKCLISEAVLRHVVGGRRVMDEQFGHLLAMGELPHITIQVIPFEHGAASAVFGPLVLLGFDDDDEPDAAYVESALGIEAVEDPDDAAALAAVWDDAASAAPSPEQSAATIAEERGRLRRR